MDSSTASLINVLNASPPPPDTTSTSATLVADTHCILGECVLYDDVSDKILWTDIHGKKFHRISLSSGFVETFALPKKLCAFALRPNGEDGYLCAWEDGFQLYDIEKGVALSELSTGEDVNPSKAPTRLNDGRCDVEGRRFICGGFFGEIKGMNMKIFKCEFRKNPDERGDKMRLAHEAIHDGMQVTNSICFSVDGETMYLTDSPTQLIHSFKYDKENGTISDKKLLYKTTMGVPDGSCVDSHGYLWNAVWRSGAGPGMVHRIDPNTGEVVFIVHMPDSTSQVSCCCFGGENMDILFITTASEGRDSDKEPNAGGLYAVKLGITGRKEARFIGN